LALDAQKEMQMHCPEKNRSIGLAMLPEPAAYKLDGGSISDKKGPMTEHLFRIRGLAHLMNMGF
jgi:hypothetical protein